MPIAVAACGGDGGGDDGTTAPEQAGGGEERPTNEAETTVDLDEFSFDPAKLTVSAGTTIEARNVGSIPHNLTIERGPDPSAPSEELAATSTFADGESDVVTVDLEPGRYALVCTVPGHREQGMVGSLKVR
jgi:plastocyanin